MNTEPMSDERLAEAAEWADGCGSAGLKGDAREMGLANILSELLAEVGRLSGEKAWFQRKATEAGTIAWELDLGRKRILDTATARNIVNQIADFYMAQIPSDEWVKVRQASNDKLDEWVHHLLASKASNSDAFALDECRGDDSCPAPTHVHGCYADLDGERCDDPRDHDWQRRV